MFSKVMCVSRILSTGGIHAFGAFMPWGACVVRRGMHGEGGMCVAKGGMHVKRGACMAGGAATVVGGTHRTGMHSCI